MHINYYVHKYHRLRIYSTEIFHVSYKIHQKDATMRFCYTSSLEFLIYNALAIGCPES